jgi:hypothetical protein
MHQESTRRHNSLFVSSLTTLALSLGLPRLIEWSPGMAGAAAAALTFIALYFMSLSLSFYLFVFSMVSRANLSRWQFVMGSIPIVLVLLIGALILSQL